MKKKNKVTKGEKMLYVGGVLCFVGMVVLKIFFGASVGKYKMNIEKKSYEISSEEKKS